MPDHPVIEKVQVTYKPDKTIASFVPTSSSPQIKVRATTNLTLKNGHQDTKIYLKIKDEQTQAVIYEVNYPITTPDISDNGMVLYKKQGNVLSITNPAIMTLKPYAYELYTEDTAGSKSSVYKIIQ